MPRWQDIAHAAVAIDPTFTGSSLVHQPALDDEVGCRVEFKVETLNPLRLFKGRGADWYLQDPDEDPRRGLVTASAGNFGQGVAYAARRHDRTVTVFAAVNANPVKVAAMRRWGAVVELVGDDFDEAKKAARRYARATGAELLVDGDHPRVAEGAGTIAYELVNQHAGTPLDRVVVPLGNGALAAGIGTWLRHAWPDRQVIAVAAAGAPAMALSWHQERIVETTRVNTIADGVAVRVPVPYALAAMRPSVDDVVEVDDTDILRAMRLVHTHLGLVVEPAGATGLAAVLADPQRYRGSTVGTVLCGGNIDPAQAQAFLYG